MIGRIAVALAVVALPISASAAPRGIDTDHDRAYALANARLARVLPPYPGARLLISEAAGGEIGVVPFQTIQRVYALPRRVPQRLIIGFYKAKLGRQWQRRQDACLVSRSRLVVALVSEDGRRLGLVADSRGAPRCYDHTGIMSDLLQVGYPD